MIETLPRPTVTTATATSSSSILVPEPTAGSYPASTWTADAPTLRDDWLHSHEWRARERGADEDIAAGRYRDFEDIDGLFAFLDEE